ncbi:MAG: TIGR03435 family protein [Acidobacteriota bacterium]
MTTCRVSRKLPLLIAVAACAIAPVAVAQAAASVPVAGPTFEVASIRQNMNPNPRWHMFFTADGLNAVDVTLRWVLPWAYGVGNNRLWSGGPEWLDERRFDIQAKWDVSKYPHPTPEQRRAMLQQLLADRFKLVVHHESKEFPLYDLLVAKNRPKFVETKPGDIQYNRLDGGAVCVVTRSRMGSLGLRGCTMTDLAQMLTGWTQSDLGRIIEDRTGLPGRYTLALQWTPENVPVAAIQKYSGPSIFTALKEQLGLELKATKGPLDTIVIDHVEMPTPN